jgi:hypothetical protein
MIDTKRLEDIFLDCLFRDEEIVDGKPTSDPIIVDGITMNVGFHKERLISYKDELKKMLDALPTEFQPTSKEGGGGWSFLNMCNTKDGYQWGEHRNMEQLCLLTIGNDLGCFPLPKDMWNVLPGGMPYFCIK